MYLMLQEILERWILQFFSIKGGGKMPQIPCHAATIFIVALPLIVILFDLATMAYGDPRCTLSATIRRWAIAFPELPWVFATFLFFLWVHLFGPSAFDR